MGANTFEARSFGKTAQEAFNKAVKEAEEWHGSRGYTGTIAEKSSFTVIDVPKGKTRVKYARDMMDPRNEEVDDDPVADKWGPAGAIKLRGKTARQYRKTHGHEGKHGDVWLFFGWASS